MEATFFYRPEVDGLRALAVLAVVFYHAHLGFPGGYVGVDLFFVISGYLITSLLLRDLERGRFSLVDFWERRVRRILPALSVSVLASVALGALWLVPVDFEGLGRSVMAQALMAANLYFSRTSGYFDGISEEKPLLHTWSLAVEEQFYLLFPLLLWGVYRFAVLRRGVALVVLLGVLAAGSLGWAVVEMGRDHLDAAFYLLPARAWELLFGSLVALWPPCWSTARRSVREGVAWTGVGLMVAPFFLYTRETAFPGWTAIPPCLGAALFIWSNGRGAASAPIPTTPGRLLAWRGAVGIGLISYSLYLWHWPVLVYAHYALLSKGSLPLAWRWGLVALSLLLAYLSWRWVETPFRTRRWCASRRAIFTYGGVATALALIAGGAAHWSGGWPERLPPTARLNDEAARDRTPRVKLYREDLEADRLFAFGATQEASPALLLWGDSHAQHLLAGLDLFAKERGIRGEAAIHPGTPPLVDAAFLRSGLKERTPAFSEAVLAYVARHKIPNVLLAAYWRFYQEQDAELLERSLRETIARLEALGCRVHLLIDIPYPGISPPKVLVRQALTGVRDESWLCTEAEHHANNEVVYRLAAEGLPVVFLDPAPRLLNPATGRYRVTGEDGVSLYYDLDHLSQSGSRRFMLPFFREALHLKP